MQNMINNGENNSRLLQTWAGTQRKPVWWFCWSFNSHLSTLCCVMYEKCCSNKDWFDFEKWKYVLICICLKITQILRWSLQWRLYLNGFVGVNRVTGVSSHTYWGAAGIWTWTFLLSSNRIKHTISINEKNSWANRKHAHLWSQNEFFFFWR